MDRKFMSNRIQIDFKSELLEALRDEEIKSRILEIAGNRLGYGQEEQSDSRYEELRDEIEKLKEEKKMLTEEKEELAKLSQEYQREKNRLDSQLKLAKKDIEQYIAREKEISERTEAVSGILNLWTRMQTIPVKHQDYLSELCGGKDIMACFSVGRDMARMKQLRQYIQDVAVEDEEDDEIIDILNELLCLCIEVSNYSKDPTEKLVRLHVCLGEEFDVATCIKSSSSRNTGYVSRIMVQGFCNQAGRVIYPSIVRLS